MSIRFSNVSRDGSCSICREEISYTASDKINRPTSILGHSASETANAAASIWHNFHADCLCNWFEASTVKPACPNCKIPAANAYRVIFTRAEEAGDPISINTRLRAVAEAVFENNIADVERFIGSNLLIPEDARYVNGWNKLIYTAAKKDRWELVRTLIAHGPLAYDLRIGMIRLSILAGELETVQALLLHNNERIESIDRGACLLKAIEQADLYIMIEILLDGEIPQSFLGLALQSAAINGHADLFRELLNRNNTFSAKDLGKTLQLASSKNQLEIVELLSGQESISPRDLGSALWTAALRGHTDILKKLASHPRISNIDLNKALQSAVRLGNVGGTKALLAGSAAFSEQDLKTALQQARQTNRQKVISCLIDALHERGLDAGSQKK